MALSITEANTVQSKYYDPTITQEVYEDSVFFSELKRKGNVALDGGSQIQWPLRYAKLGKSQAVGSRQQITYEQKQTRTAAVLDWKYYLSQAMISWDERVKNTGKAQVVNLLKEKTTELMEDMYDKFATDLFATSQGTLNISSINTMVDSTTDYAGISYSDFAEWAAHEDASATELCLYGSTSVSYYMNQSTFGKDKPTMLLTTRDLWSKFESLLEPSKRYQDTETANAGFNNVLFHGAKVVNDVYVPSGYLYGLNMDKFEIRYHPDFDMKKTDWMPLEQAGYPNAMVKIVSWAGEIMCRSRHTNFKMTALDYTI